MLRVSARERPSVAYMAIVGSAAITNAIPKPNASTELMVQTSLNVMAMSLPQEQTSSSGSLTDPAPSR